MKMKSILATLVAACFSFNVFAVEVSAETKALSLEVISIIKATKERELTAPEQATLKSFEEAVSVIIDTEISEQAEAANQDAETYLNSPDTFLAYVAQLKTTDTAGLDDGDKFILAYKSIIYFEFYKRTVVLENYESEEIQIAYAELKACIVELSSQVGFNVHINDDIE